MESITSENNIITQDDEPL